MTRSHPLEPVPYTGIVSIVSGEIAEDLATYMVGLVLCSRLHWSWQLGLLHKLKTRAGRYTSKWWLLHQSASSKCQVCRQQAS